MQMNAYPFRPPGADRARPQGRVRVQQRFGVVEGRVRRDAAVARRAATACTRSQRRSDDVDAQRSSELRRHAVDLSSAAGERTRRGRPEVTWHSSAVRTICATNADDHDRVRRTRPARSASRSATRSRIHDTEPPLLGRSTRGCSSSSFHISHRRGAACWAGRVIASGGRTPSCSTATSPSTISARAGAG